MTVRHPVAADSPDSSRLPTVGRRLSNPTSRLPNPTMLSMLGLVGLPSYLFPIFRPLRPLIYCFLFGFWPFVGWIAPILRGNGDGTASPKPTDWIDTGGRAVRLRSVLSVLALQVQPVVVLTGMAQLVGHCLVLARHRGRLPAPDSHESDVEYRLPFEGEWTVVSGSPDRDYSHSWGILAQRYAHDFVITDADGRTHTGGRSGPDQFLCFGEPIVAPADGVVVGVRNSHRDHHRTNGWLDPLQRSILGNYVMIRHAADEYSLCAHLKQGSVPVEVGDPVDRGQRIGACGHSGNSTEPHLHFHVQDHPNLYLGAGVPVAFKSVTTAHPQLPETAHERSYVHAGQRVTHR